MINYILNLVDKLCGYNKTTTLSVSESKNEKIIADGVVEIKFDDDFIEIIKEINPIGYGGKGNSAVMTKAIKSVFDDMSKLSDEEFKNEIDQYRKYKKGDCEPITCDGECQSIGWCNVATEFREKIHPRINVRPQELKNGWNRFPVKKKKKNKQKKKNNWGKHKNKLHRKYRKHR